jgi:hypothetical protein
MSIREVIPDKCVRDTRSITELKKITISGYLKADIIRTIKDGLLQNEIENVCRWIAELHCTGDYTNIWSILEDYYWKYINIMNIRYWKYHTNRQKRWKILMEEYKKENYLQSRNNNEIRNIIADLVSILLINTKHYEFIPTKIKEVEMRRDFLLQRLEFQNIQTDTRFVRETIERIFQYGVNNEVKLIMYEIYCLLFFTTSPQYMQMIEDNIRSSDQITKRETLDKKMREWKQRQFQKIFYWIEWIIKWGGICKKRKETMIHPDNSKFAERFNYYSHQQIVENKGKKTVEIHWIVYIWDFLEKMMKMRAYDKKTKEMIEYLEKVFFTKWKGSLTITKNIVYMAIYIFLMGLPREKTLIQNKKIWYQICLTMDEWYEEIQKNCNEWNEENWQTLDESQQNQNQPSNIQYTNNDNNNENYKQPRMKEKTKKELAMELRQKMMKRLSYLDNVLLCKKNPNVVDYFDSEQPEIENE